MFTMIGTWSKSGQKMVMRQLEEGNNKYILRAKMQDMVRHIAEKSNDTPVWCGENDVYVTDCLGNNRHIYIREV